MSADDGSVLKLIVAIATFPFILGILWTWITRAVEKSENTSLLMTLLRVRFGPVARPGQTPESYFYDLARFWLQIGVCLALSLIAVYSIATWHDPNIADDVVFGAMVYLVGPVLAVAAFIISLVFLMRS